MACGSLLLLLTLVTSSALIGDANTETHDLYPCEGENLTLSCNYTGNVSDISLTYTMDNASGTVICNTTCSYTLDNITSAENGVYDCSVDNITVSAYNVVVMTSTLAHGPVCSANSMDGPGSNSSFERVIYVREVDNITLGCSMNGNNPLSLAWSYQDNGTLVSTGNVEQGVSPMLTYVIQGNDSQLVGRVFTCEATACASETRNCTVGPIYAITEKNFYIERSSETIYVGDNVTIECVTNLTGTETRWINENATDSSLVIENSSLLVFENILVDVSGREFLCELFAVNDSNNPLDTRMTSIVVVDLTMVTASTPIKTNRDISSQSSTDSTDASTATDNAPDRTTPVLPTGGSPLNVAAIAGGAAGGAVLLILIIILIIVVCRSKRKSDGDSVVHRPKKKTTKEDSKKHRSAILSLRHKLPLFSTPYDDGDDDEEEKVGHNAPADTDVDTIIMAYRPKSKIASQIHVDLEADDDDEGTVENGFVPAKLVAANDEDESPYAMGVIEGRLGIMGPGTFAAANIDSEKLVVSPNDNKNSNDDDEDADTGADMQDPYTRVYKPNNPGDNSFDNMTYGPIKGVDDKAKASMYDEGQATEISQDGKRSHSNETDNADDVDKSNSKADVVGEGNLDRDDSDVAQVSSENTDITKDKHEIDRESAAYAEIPPHVAND